MSRIPDIHDVLSSEEICLTAQSIASLQLPSGMIPWFVGGHCDPWNHVETAMALDVAGPYALPDQMPHDETERWNEPPIGPEWAATLAPHYFNWRKVSIYGGSNEIQKNIIAKAILGL